MSYFSLPQYAHWCWNLAGEVFLGFLYFFSILAVTTPKQGFDWYGSPYLLAAYGMLVLLLLIALVRSQLLRSRERKLHKQQLAALTTENEKLDLRRKAAESQLGFHSNIISSCSGGVLHADAAGIVTLASGPLIGELGFAPEQLIGRHHFSALDKPSRRTVLRSIADQSDPLPKYQCEVQIRRPDTGARHWLRICGARLRDGSRELFVTIVQDINAEVQERAKTESLLQLNTARIVCQDISRDFDRIHRTIGAYSGLIEDESLRILIQKANDEATRLVDDLIAFSSQAEKEEELIRVADFINSLRPMFRLLVSSEVELIVDSQIDSSTQIQMAPDKLQLALLSIVSNSVQSLSENNGTIQINLRQVDLAESEAKELAVFPGSFVHITVRHDANELPANFATGNLTPSFATKSVIGRNFGWASLQDTVSHAGGVIKVASKAGHGTTVSILLPQYSHFATSSDLLEPLQGTFTGQPMGEGRKIILVRPGSTFQDGIQDAIVELGFGVETCKSAEEAWEAMRRVEDTEFLVSYVDLDAMSGFELYRLVRQQRPTLKTILISNYKSRPP